MKHCSPSPYHDEFMLGGGQVVIRFHYHLKCTFIYILSSVHGSISQFLPIKHKTFPTEFLKGFRYASYSCNFEFYKFSFGLRVE